MIAYTRSPAVSIPINGEAAIEAVLRRYGIRWLLLTPRPVPRSIFQHEPSDRPLVEIYDGQRRSIGSLGLTYSGEFASLRLFRVALGAGATIDQRQLWEGNSVLRGQTPLVRTDD